MNIKLTIDSGIQHFAEKAAEHAMKEYQTKKVYCIVMEPKTGKVLAMVNKPTFDSNQPPRELGFEGMQKFIKNFTCKDSVDPGSIFKVITLSAALEEKVVNSNTTFYCPGYRIVDGDKIKCWKTEGHGTETLEEVVQNSCNPAFMDMALWLGKDKYYSYLDGFGFGKITGIDVLGESAGILIPKEAVKNVDLARIGFGQSISATPIQIITGISAAINGGNLMTPYLVEEIFTSNIDSKTGNITNETIESFEPHVEQRVISESTSETVRNILESVVDEGSGKNAAIAGYSIGGKTGTAQKYGEDHQVITDRHVSSFIGFAPVDDPKLIVLMMLDEPIAEVDYGSIVAAPYVKMILEDALPYLGVEEDRDDGIEKLTTVVPDLTGIPLTEAISMIEAANLDYSLDGGEGDVVAAQIPMPEAEVPENTKLLLYLDEQADIQTIVPDVEGLTVREANAVLLEKKLRLVINGKGLAVSQTPMAGEVANVNGKVTVVFE
jgi:stage V sporulation protein D (sporulation-specific penicillin-binding protein)